MRDAGTYFIKEANPNMSDFDALPPAVMSKYERLKKKKLPVVNTLRFDQKNNNYLMTDVSKNGQNEIIDIHNVLKEAKIKPINVEEIKSEIKRLAIQAFDSGNGVLLSHDCYAIIVDEKGIGKVMLLDLGAGTFLLENHTTVELEKPIFVDEETAVSFAELFRVFPRIVT